MTSKFNRGLDEQTLEGGVGGMGGAGGRYTSSGKKSFDPDKDAMNTIAAVFGAPMAAAGVAGLATKKSVDPDDMRKSLKYEKEKRESDAELKRETRGMKKGGTASSRADGVAQRGKTKGTMIMCGGGMTRGKK
jgi:hypothetical protein